MLAICMELLCHIISQLPQPSGRNEWTGASEQVFSDAFKLRASGRRLVLRRRPMKYLLPPQPGAPAWEFVYFSCRRPGCGNFVSWQPRAGSFHSLNMPGNLTFMERVLYFITASEHRFTHTRGHTHTPRVLCATRFSPFLRRQRDGVLKIDLVSEAESVFLACALHGQGRRVSKLAEKKL